MGEIEEAATAKHSFSHFNTCSLISLQFRTGTHRFAVQLAHVILLGHIFFCNQAHTVVFAYPSKVSFI